MLNREEIAARLPHAGSMCLLDRVLNWDEKRIRCAAKSHRDADNPLREPTGLPMLAGIEYAAQCAALHGALVRSERAPRSGVLAALKNVVTSRVWLDQCAADVEFETVLLHSDPAGGVFSFSAFDGDDCVLTGQFTLMYMNDISHRNATSNANDGDEAKT